MKSRLILAVAVVIMLNGGIAWAQYGQAKEEATDHNAKMDNGAMMMKDDTMMDDSAAMGAEAVAETVKVNNTLCPVEGNKIGSMGEPVMVEYKGKTYSLCCAECKAAFMKDPDAFSKKADEEAASATAAEGQAK